MQTVGEQYVFFLYRGTIITKLSLNSLDFTSDNSPMKSQEKIDVFVCAYVFLCEFQGAEHKTRSALTPPAGPLTEVQLLEAEMHFLSSHHWHPLVLAVQLAQSENR